MFVITDHTSSSKKIKLDKTIFNHIDDCINFNFNYESMRTRLASHHSNNSTNNPNTNVDLVPITFGSIISRVNNHDKNSKLKKVKKKNDTISIDNKKDNYENQSVKILLDSGASASIISNSYVAKNDYVKNKTSSNWATMAGTFKTNRVATVSLKLPELNHTAEISEKFHVTEEKFNYDVIIGRETLRKLGIVLDFKKSVTMWNNVIIPMKPANCTIKEHFIIRDSERVHRET